MNIAKAARGVGIECVAVVGQATPTTLRQLEALGVRTSEIGAGESGRVLDDLIFYLGLWRFSRRNRNSIVHHVFPLGFELGFNPVAVLSSKRTMVVGPILYPSTEEPDIQSVLDYFKEPRQGRPRWHVAAFSKLWRWLYFRTLSRSDVLIFDCEETRQLHSKIMPALNPKKYQIMNSGGVDESEYIPSSQSHDSRVRVGTLTYFRRRKRVDILLRAAGLMNPDKFSLRLGGDGPRLEELRVLSDSILRKPPVEFVGRIPRPRVPEFLQSLDVFVSLDRVPHLTLSGVQEAMMSGVAIVCSNVDDSQTVRRLSYGIETNTGDPAMVADAVTRIASSAETMDEMKVAARMIAVEKFSLNVIGEQLRALYGSLGTEGPDTLPPVSRGSQSVGGKS